MTNTEIETEYKSKIGLEIFIPIAVLLGFTFYLHISNGIWLGIIINFLVSLLIVYLCLQTKYIIIDSVLIVKAGFFINKTIPIQEIRCITKSNNPLSSPALSLDRIQIIYGKSRSVIISPKERTIFVNQLQKINPNIKYFGKN